MIKKIDMLRFLQTVFITQICFSVIGQTCPEGTVFLTTQEQVDSFGLLYPDCDTIHGELWLYSVDIQNLEGIRGVKVVTNNVVIQGDWATSAVDLTNFTSIGGLNMNFTSGIRDIAFADDIHLLTEVITIGDNADLERVDGMNVVEGFNGFIRIERNDKLRLIPAFGGIDTLTGLSVRWCDSLRRIDAFHDVQINTGQTTIARVKSLENMTMFSSLEEAMEDIVLIATSVDLDTFVAFDNLKLAHRNLDIMNFSGAASLPTFPKLTRAGRIDITSSSFRSIKGFDSLTVIERELFISNFLSISEFDAFHNLESVGDRFVLQQLDGLEEMSGFENLRFVGFSFNFGSCYNLKSLPAFPELVSVRSRFEITGNISLELIDGFNSLTEIADGIVNGEEFRCQYNHKLTGITGFQNLNIDNAQSFIISENPLLSLCNAIPICDYLDRGGSHATFENNAAGCNTEEEVIESCQGVSTDDIEGSQVVAYPNPATDVITISSGVHSKPQTSTVRIYNNIGKLVMVQEIVNGKVSIQDLLEGVYVLLLADDSGRTYSTRIVKQ